MNEDRTETVGFIGLGNMGKPMASHLARTVALLRVYDIDSGVAAAFAHDVACAVAAEHAAGVAAGASTVILMVPNSDAVESLTDGGLLDALEPGAVLVDMGSSEPLRTRALAERAAERGASLVDAPVSGGVSGARNATLTVMVGGADAAVAAVRPLLETMGKQVHHVGPPGAGHALKALNNYLSATHLLATSEAVLIGEQFGLDADVMLDVINKSSGRSASSENKWPNFILPGTYDSGFGLRLMVKDLRIAVGLAEQLGESARLGEAVVTLWGQAGEALPAAADHTEIARWLRDR